MIETIIEESYFENLDRLERFIDFFHKINDAIKKEDF